MTDEGALLGLLLLLASAKTPEEREKVVERLKVGEPELAPYRKEDLVAATAADWDIVYLGNNRYWLYMKTAYTALGSNTIEKIFLKKPFKLLMLFVAHLDAAFDFTTDAFTWTFYFPPAPPVFFAADQYAALVTYTNDTSRFFIEEFGGSYSLPSGEYEFHHNTTNTDRIKIALLIEVE